MDNEKTNKKFMSLYNELVLIYACGYMFINLFIKLTWIIHESRLP